MPGEALVEVTAAALAPVLVGFEDQQARPQAEAGVTGAPAPSLSFSRSSADPQRGTRHWTLIPGPDLDGLNPIHSFDVKIRQSK